MGGILKALLKCRWCRFYSKDGSDEFDEKSVYLEVQVLSFSSGFYLHLLGNMRELPIHLLLYVFWTSQNDDFLFKKFLSKGAK